MNYDNSTVRFYYLRDDSAEKKPIGCVCLIRENNDTFHRGISICNTKKGDRFTRKTARWIAHSRALKAMNGFGTDFFDQFGYAPNAGMVPLSRELDKKFEYVLKEYGLGDMNSKDQPVLQKMQAKVDLTVGEYKMWEDHLNPNWVRKDKTSSEQV